MKWIKKYQGYLRKLEYGLEEITLFRLLSGAIVFLAAILVFATSWQAVFGQRWTYRHTFFVLILFIVLLTVADVFNVLLGGRRRRGISLRDQKIQTLNEIISHVGRDLLDYEILDWRIRRILHENGDADITREMEIQAIQTPVPMIFFETWTIGVDRHLHANQLELRAIDLDSNELLTHVVLDDEGNHNKFAITLKNTLHPGERFRMRIDYKLPGSWTPLFQTGADIAGISTGHKIHHYGFYFELPSGWGFPQPPVIVPEAPLVGPPQIDTNPVNNHSTLTLALENLDKGDRYNVHIVAKKKR